MRSSTNYTHAFIIRQEMGIMFRWLKRLSDSGKESPSAFSLAKV